MGNGCAISADTALQVAAVFRCVDLISKTMAALPLHMYRDRNDGKQKAKDHPLYKITNILPNPTTTAYEMMQMLVANILLTRGGYLRIVRNRSGVITALKICQRRTVHRSIPTAATGSSTYMPRRTA